MSDFVRHKWQHLKHRHWWEWRCRACGASFTTQKGGATPSAARLLRNGISSNCLEQRERHVAEVLES